MNFITDLSKNKVYENIYDAVLNVIDNLILKDMSLYFMLKRHDCERSCRDFYTRDSLFA